MTLRSDAGFTLLELLVSMAVLGLLSVLTFSSLSFGTRVWERAQRAAADLSKVRLAEETLQTDLSRLYPESLGTAGERHIDFEGSSTNLTYLRSKANLLGAFERVSLGLTANALTEWSVPELASSQAPSRNTLLDGVESVQFSYFGPAPNGDRAPQWWQTWQKRSTAPLLIRLQVTLAGGRSMPEVIAAPRIEADVDCIFDPLTKNCQGRS